MHGDNNLKRLKVILAYDKKFPSPLCFRRQVEKRGRRSLAQRSTIFAVGIARAAEAAHHDRLAGASRLELRQVR